MSNNFEHDNWRLYSNLVLNTYFRGKNIFNLCLASENSASDKSKTEILDTLRQFDQELLENINKSKLDFKKLDIFFRQYDRIFDPLVKNDMREIKERKKVNLSIGAKKNLKTRKERIYRMMTNDDWGKIS